MKKITLRTALIAAALLCGAKAWADTAPATVKMTYVNYDAPDESYGEIKAGETAKAGYNKDSSPVGFGTTSWGVNYVTYIQVDASDIDGTITGATLSVEVSGSTDSKRTTAWGVGYNSSTWSADMTYNSADKTKTNLGGVQGTSTKSASTFETKEFDISASLVGNDDKIVTLVVFETVAGGGYIKNPSVTIIYTPAGAPTASYTINYKYGETIVKTESGTEAVGNTVTAEAVIDDDDDVHYLITASEQPSMEIASNEVSNVLNVDVRKPYKATLNVTTTIGGESNVISTNLVETDAKVANWSYYYPLYIQKDGVYYISDETTSFGESGTFADGDIINKTAVYSSTASDNIVYYTEGTDAAGWDARFSNGNTANIASQNKRDRGLFGGTLAAGVYELVAKVTAINRRSIVIRQNDNDPLASITTATGDETGIKTAEFTLTESTTGLFINGANSDNGKTNLSEDFDYVFIRKIGNYTEDVTIQSIGFATYSSENAVDFSGVAGLKAYIASANKDGEITFTPVTKVAAGQGVLLQGTANTYTIPATDEEIAAPATNYLIAAETEIASLASEDDGKLNYILNNVGGTPGFYAAAGRKVAAGKAYLQLPAAAGAKAFIPFNFGLANAIETVSTDVQPADSRIYNLSGQRLSSLQKGLNIVNGKKIYVK